MSEDEENDSKTPSRQQRRLRLVKPNEPPPEEQDEPPQWMDEDREPTPPGEGPVPDPAAEGFLVHQRAIIPAQRRTASPRGHPACPSTDGGRCDATFLLISTYSRATRLETSEERKNLGTPDFGHP